MSYDPRYFFAVVWPALVLPPTRYNLERNGIHSPFLPAKSRDSPEYHIKQFEVCTLPHRDFTVTDRSMDIPQTFCQSPSCSGISFVASIVDPGCDTGKHLNMDNSIAETAGTCLKPQKAEES